MLIIMFELEAFNGLWGGGANGRVVVRAGDPRKTGYFC